MLERALAQARFFPFLLIGHEKREVFVQTQSRNFEACFDNMFAAVVCHAAEHANAPQRPVGIEVQRHVMFASEQRRRAGTVIAGYLR